MALNFSFIRLLICLLKFHTLQTHTWDYHAHNSILFLFKKLGSICLLISFMLSCSILLRLFHEMKKKIFHLFFPEDILNFSIPNIVIIIVRVEFVTFNNGLEYWTGFGSLTLGTSLEKAITRLLLKSAHSSVPVSSI